MANRRTERHSLRHGARGSLPSYGAINEILGYEGSTKLDTWGAKYGRRERAKEIQLSALVDFEYRRWATANKLSKHTRQMLAMEHFDSMATIKMLRPEMVNLLNLSEDESNRLLRALGRLHMSSKPGSTPEMTSDSGYVDDSSQSDGDSEAEYLQRMSKMKHSHSMPTVFNDIYLPGPKRSSSRTSGLERPRGGSPASSYIHGNDDSQSIGTVDSVLENVHSLRPEELQDILEYMVLEDITTREIQEEILSQNTYRKKVGLLQKVMMEAGEHTKFNLEEILRANYNAALPSVGGNLDGVWEESENASDRWKDMIRGHSKRVSWVTEPVDETPNYNNNTIKSNNICNPHDPMSSSNVSLDSKVFFINVEDHGTQGLLNPYFEDDDGVLELQKYPLLRFGHKGRQDGELQDASSIISLENEEVIVTDHVKSKLQIFDKFGAPVKTLAVSDKFQPWDVVLSPHGWIAVTFKSSKTLTILDRNGKEISSVADEIFKNPTGIAVDKDNRYIVTDAVSNQVYIHTHDVESTRFFTQKLNSTVKFNQPRYVTVGNNGNVIVSDTGNHCVKVFNPEGELECQFGSYGQRPGYFRCPYGVCTDHRGNILVADHYNNRVSMFSPRGRFLSHLVTGSRGLKRPQGLHISPDRKLYITHGRMKASEILVFELPDCGTDVPVVENTYL